jgi:hypothetical protein
MTLFFIPQPAGQIFLFDVAGALLFMKVMAKTKKSPVKGLSF